MVKIIQKLKIKWFKNDDDKGGAMQSAISTVSAGNVVVHSQTQRDGRMWADITPNKLLCLLSKNYGLYEVITSFPHKLYFDIDSSASPDINFLNNIKNLISDFFPNIDLAISGSVTPEKTSYHMVAQNYLIHNEKERQQIKIAIKLLASKHIAFDHKVYTKNRNMKCINQSKDDGRVQQIIENQDMKAHLITCYIPTYSLEYKFPEHVTTEIFIEKSKGTFDMTCLPKIILEVPSNINIVNVNSIQLLSMFPLDKSFDFAYTHRIMRFAYFNSISFEEFYAWILRKHDDVAKWKMHWSNADKFPSVTFDQAINLLGYFYPNIKKDLNFRRFAESFKLKLPIQYIDSITPLCFNVPEKFVIFNVGMGGGKTHQTINFLKTTSSFVWVAPNKALAHNTFNRIQESKIDCEHYLQYKTKEKQDGILVNNNNLIIVANSLHYLTYQNTFDNTQVFKSTDVIIIDEIETLLQKWFGTFMEHKKENWNVFLHLIRSAKQVILLDAFITRQTLEFIEMIGGTSVLYQRKNEPVIRTVNYISNVPTMYNNIINDLKLGLRLFIFYPYKNESSKNASFVSMIQLHTMLEGATGKKGIFYNADIDDKIKLGLKNVNDSWNQVDFVITNTIVTCGVNYDCDLHFDKEHLFLSKFSTPRDVIQVSYRPRDLTSNQIDVGFMGNMTQQNAWEDDSAIIDCPIYSKVIQGVLNEKCSPVKKTFQLLCDKAHYKQAVDKQMIEKHLIAEIMNLVDKYKMTSVYLGIEDINRETEEIIQCKMFNSTATMHEKFQLSKFHFKNQFENGNDEDLEEAWNCQYLSFFKQLKKMIIFDNSIATILKDWGGTFALSKNPKLSPELVEKIFKEFKFKFLTPKSNPVLILKEIFNTYFGLAIILSEKDKKHNGYTFEFNEDIDINRWYNFILNKSSDKDKWIVPADDIEAEDPDLL